MRHSQTPLLYRPRAPVAFHPKIALPGRRTNRTYTEQFANNPSSTLVRDVLPDDASFEVVDGGTFSTTGKFACIIDGEIIGVGARDGAWFSTLTRGDESTTRATHLAGATVTQILTARSYVQGIVDRAGSVVTPTSAGLVLLASQTASASATLEFLTRNVSGQSGALFQTDYNQYIFDFDHLVHDTNGAHFYVQFSYDGGATWTSAVNSYFWGDFYHSNQPATGTQNDLSITSQAFSLGNSIANFGGVGLQGVRGTFTLFSPTDVATHIVRWSTNVLLTDSRMYEFFGSGWDNQSTNDVDGVRFFPSGGLFTSGTIRVYALKLS